MIRWAVRLAFPTAALAFLWASSASLWAGALAAATLGLILGLATNVDLAVNRVGAWIRLAQRGRINAITGVPIRNRADAERWLALNPGRRDLAAARVLALAGRHAESLAVLDGLPDAASPMNLYHRTRIQASLSAGSVPPNIPWMRGLVEAIPDPWERAYARAAEATAELSFAARGLSPSRDATWYLRAVAHEIRLPALRELWLLALGQFPGVAVALISLAVVVAMPAAGFVGDWSVALAPAGPGSFVATGSMSHAHLGGPAVALADGRVLVVGGQDVNVPGPQDAAEIYDPGRGTFSATGSLITPRWHETATLLADGRVLVAGGFATDSLESTLASAEIYDPRTGWFSATGPMQEARADQTATLLPDGRVLIAGGSTSTDNATTSAEIFDPTTGQFAPTSSMNEPRVAHTATLLHDGRVLIAGGSDLLVLPGLGPSGNATDSAEVFDPNRLSFTAVSPMTQRRAGHTATLLPDGRVLVTGGQQAGSGLASAEIWDPETSRFAATGSMARPRSAHSATLLKNGLVLVAGGWASALPWSSPYPSGYYGPQESAELFDPQTGSFRLTGSMDWIRVLHSATILPSGRVLITGGMFVPDGRAALYQP